MKKLTALLLTVVIVLALAACGSSAPAATAAPAAAPAATEAPAAEPVAETQAQPTEKEQTVGQVAKEEGDKLAKEAIKAGAQAGSEELKNVAKQSQTR